MARAASGVVARDLVRSRVHAGKVALGFIGMTIGAGWLVLQHCGRVGRFGNAGMASLATKRCVRRIQKVALLDRRPGFGVGRVATHALIDFGLRRRVGRLFRHVLFGRVGRSGLRFGKSDE